MKTITFVAITLISGAIAGTILGAVNQIIVEPYVDRAIQLETENAGKSGEMINPLEFAAYRVWQRGGEIAAGTILGLSLGSLFGIVFAYGRGSVPGSNNKKKALIIAGILWFALFLLPALKYPANPPAVGNPETIYYRQSIYLGFLAISGFSALGLSLLYRKIGAMHAKKLIIPAVYAAIMAGGYLKQPAKPAEKNAPIDLSNSFLILRAFPKSMIWGLLSITL